MSETQDAILGLTILIAWAISMIAVWSLTGRWEYPVLLTGVAYLWMLRQG